MRTNLDGTTRSVAYGGSGSGGEVATMIDEVLRKQTITTDILGRVITARAYNLNQTTVFSSATNIYNIRDQVLSSAVTQATNGTSETTSMTYDGYGRLSTMCRSSICREMLIQTATLSSTPITTTIQLAPLSTRERRLRHTATTIVSW